jgi:hypothetical protein
MNSPMRKPSTPIVPAPLTDAALDAALRDDSILPSSGFAASVMDAVHSESAVAAGLQFPWKRAIPGLALAALAALAVLAMLVGAIVSTFSHAARAAPLALASAPAATYNWRLQLQSLLHSATTAGVIWPLLALTLSALCLLLCRRLIASH